MKKDEIFFHTPWLTESVFRKLVTAGIITTLSKGRGKGRGKGTEPATYAENTIEVLKCVDQLSDSVRNEDLIYAVLWRGHEVDYEKLKGRLFTDLSSLTNYVKLIGAIPQDFDKLEKIASARLQKLKPGKPSNTDKKQRKAMLEKNLNDLQEEAVMFNRIAQGLPIGRYMLKSTAGSLEEESLQVLDEWLTLDKLLSMISASSHEDLRQVHNAIVIINEYIRMFRSDTPNLNETIEYILVAFTSPMFLKVYTYLLLAPPIRNFILQQADENSKARWKGFLKEFKSELAESSN